jgi:hypothetical protein
VVAHTCNSSTREVEVRVLWVWGQSGLYSETLKKQTNKKKTGLKKELRKLAQIDDDKAKNKKDVRYVSPHQIENYSYCIRQVWLF